MANESLSERIIGALEPLLGKHTARRALTHVCEKLGTTEDALSDSAIEEARAALAPILRTLLGKDVARRVLESLGGAVTHEDL